MGRFVGQMIKPIFWVEYGLTRFQISTTTPCFVILAAAYFLSSPLAPMGKKNKRSSTSGDVPANTKKHKGSSTTEENLEDDDKPKKPKKAEGKAGGTSEPNTNPRKENVEDDDNKKKAKKAEQKDLRRRCRKLLERSLSKIRNIHSTDQTWMTSYTNLCNSWADRRPVIIAPHVTQEEGNYPAMALFQQWFAMMTLANRKTDGGLTVESISNGLDPQFVRASRGGLQCMQAAIPFMEKHVQKMKVYTRPNPEDVSDLKPFEEFENFVGSLLKKNPIAVNIRICPSYNEVDPKGIRCPTELERIRSYLAKDGMSASGALLLVGDGFSFLNGEKIPYWVLYESAEDPILGCGFTRVRKNQGLILAAVEIEL